MMPCSSKVQVPEVLRILESEKLSLLQKSERLRHLLKRMRYPLLSSWEKAFRDSLEKAGWPREISIEHSPFFEEEEMTVQFSFKNSQEFQSQLQRLQQVASREEFTHLFQHPAHE
jgi:hypothetical protein